MHSHSREFVCIGCRDELERTGHAALQTQRQCLGMCVDVCLEMHAGPGTPAPTASICARTNRSTASLPASCDGYVLRHVFRHVLRLVFRLVFRHAFRLCVDLCLDLCFTRVL